MSNQTREYAKELVSQMTLEEKMSQLIYHSAAIERLNVPAYNWWNEALHGVARAGVATIYPQSIGLAATFDKELIHKIADTISTEGRAKFSQFSKHGDRGIYKGLTFWSPNVNIFRDPRWGRGHETFGEDPYLAGELGVAFIKGIQGEDKDHLKAAACAKHFAVHSGPEALRHSFDAKASKRDMYDTYLYAFKRCIDDGDVEAIMGAYNRVNGEPACGSKTLLKDILRKDWKFEGHVVSDCWAVIDFHENHKVTETIEESAAMALNNGCDLNCGNAFLHLHAAYEQGLITEETITEAAERLMDVRIRLGMMEDYPSPYENIPYEKVECREHTELSVEAARRSMVMLKNNGLLPLDKSKLKTIAVIGPNADSRDALIGNYYGTSSEYITPIEGIRNYVGEDTRVMYAQGCHLYSEKVEHLAEEKDRLAEALTVAEQADIVVLCLGLDATLEGEEGDTGNSYASGDKPNLKLPGLQQELLEKVTQVGKPVILLLSAGSAIDLSWAHENVDAIIDTWYPGARGGKAIAQILFGEASPSGKLPVTFYLSDEDLPPFEDYDMSNRTYRYTKCKVLYPFGYGLTYSSVEQSNTKIDKECSDVGEKVKVSTVVKNTGNMAVNETVQLYIKDVEASVVTPIWQLRKVENVHLMPGEERAVEMELSSRDFAIITDEGKCIVEPGEFKIAVGTQQPDTQSEKLTGKQVDILTIQKSGEIIEVEY